MKLEEQVLSIEQARHLQELGLEIPEAAFVWAKTIASSQYELYAREKHSKGFWRTCESIIPTYTLDEILEFLPKKIKYNGLAYKLESDCEHWISYYTGSDDDRDYLEESNSISLKLIDAAYNLLCWVVKTILNK